MSTAADAVPLVRCAAVFEVGDPPRLGQLAFYDPAGGQPARDVGEPGTLTVAVPSSAGGPVECRPVAAVRVPVTDAVAALLRATGPPDAGAETRRVAPPGVHPAVAFWAATVAVALHLVARRRLLPGVSPGGYDAWRVGPFDAADVERIRALGAAMPALARAAPVPGTSPVELVGAEVLVRGFLDAVADAMPRTPAAAVATGSPLFAAAAPQRVPELRTWSDQVAAGIDAGVRVSLRLEVPDGDYARHPFRAVLQTHSLADPTLVVDAARLWEGEDDHAFGPRARIDTTLAVRRATPAWPVLERLLQQPVPDAVSLADEDVDELLDRAAARLLAVGVEVHWPRDLRQDLTATAALHTVDASPPTDLRGFFGEDAALRFDWRLALAGEPLTDAEMDRLAEAHRPVVRLRDRWVLVDPALARRAREQTPHHATAVEVLGAALTGTTQLGGTLVPVAADGWLDALRAYLTGSGGGPTRQAHHAEVRQPTGLAATLREYQLAGLRWLDRVTSLGLGGCLADDMGLGKTITLIALHLHRHQHDDTEAAAPTLVVCPASLLGNWEREIGRFAPETAVGRFHGARRSPDIAPDGVVLTTYGTLLRDADVLATRRWGLLVADEAQHVKNPRSRTARALRTIPAAARVALTGTPIENTLAELWAILDWTTPGLLGTLPAFRARFVEPVEARRADQPTASATAGAAAAQVTAPATDELARLVRPFLLRRRKSDPGIAPELPAKTETDHPVALTTEQAGLYEAVVRETLAEIRRSDGMRRRGLVMTLLTSLKQICNHPAQYLREATHDPAIRLAGRSGKLELLDELVDSITAEGGGLLVFTQYVAMARLVERHLTDRGVPTLLLHGGTSVRRRDELVRQFQDSPDGAAPVFLLSLKAAGTGLNLTRADHVVHYDRWWNPAVEEQATDRAHRIGQTRPVQVHRLITEGTLEDQIAAMLRDKKALAEAVLGSGEAALSELSDAALAELVELRRAW